MADELFDREASVCQHTRHIRSEESVREEEEDDGHHRQPHNTPRRLNDEQDTDAADDGIHR